MAPRIRAISDPHRTGTAELAGELKAVHEALCAMDQDESVQEALPPTLPATLSQPSLLQHRDKAVRILTCCNLASLLRLFAPTAPFTPDTIHTIFTSFWRSLKHLQDDRDPLYHLAFFLLESLATVRSVVLIWEIGGGVEGCLLGLLELVFQTLAGTVKGKQARLYMVEVLQAVFEEGEEMAVPLECIKYLLDQYESIDSGPHLLAVDLLRGCAGRFQLPLAQHYADLLSCSASDVASEKELRKLDLLLPKLASDSSLLIVNILPQLEMLLLSDSADSRIAAVKTVAAVLNGLSKHDSQSLFATWLGRRNDKSVQVRIGWIRAAISVLQNSGLKSSLLPIFCERFEDPDPTIRTKALEGLMQVEDVYNPELIECVIERAKDKKEEVRFAALNLLTKYSFNSHVALNGLFKLMASVSDLAVRLQYEEAIEDLLLKSNDVVKLIDGLDEDGFVGFRVFLRSKSTYIKHMQAFCLLSDKLDSPGNAAKLHQLVQMMAERCRFPLEAAATLVNISHLPDSEEVMTALKAIKNPSTPTVANVKLLHYLQSEHKNDSLPLIAKRASHQLFNMEFISKILDQSADGRLLTSLLSEFPSLFSNYGTDLEGVVVRSGLDPQQLSAFYKFLRSQPSGYSIKKELKASLVSLFHQISISQKAITASRLQFKQAGFIVAFAGLVGLEDIVQIILTASEDHQKMLFSLQALISFAQIQKIPFDIILELNKKYSETVAKCSKYPSIDSLEPLAACRILVLRLLSCVGNTADDPVELALKKREVWNLFTSEINLPQDLTLIKYPYLGKVRWTCGKGILKLLGPEVPLKTVMQPFIWKTFSLSQDPIEMVRYKFYSYISKSYKSSYLSVCILSMAAHDSSFQLRASVLNIGLHK